MVYGTPGRSWYLKELKDVSLWWPLARVHLSVPRHRESDAALWAAYVVWALTNNRISLDAKPCEHCATITLFRCSVCQSHSQQLPAAICRRCVALQRVCLRCVHGGSDSRMISQRSEVTDDHTIEIAKCALQAWRYAAFTATVLPAERGRQRPSMTHGIGHRRSPFRHLGSSPSRVFSVGLQVHDCS